jgi:hemoglobin-like flavoprotein
LFFAGLRALLFFSTQACFIFDVGLFCFAQSLRPASGSRDAARYQHPYLRRQMTASANPIHRSFELAAERCEDLTPLVYRRLFREHPEAEAMFRREGSDPVKGSMLALTIDAILDFSGDRTGHFRMIDCELSSHDAYGTPRDLFGEFFGVIADTMREILGTEWSPEIDEAWRKLLGEIDSVVAQSEA